jgi:hypothetical protein
VQYFGGAGEARRFDHLHVHLHSSNLVHRML